ncbi:hypothetical protein AG1IA_10033 [Rhizoctonia solani AG-1 IA]|uniref:Uncharacterized protein n=1 Tax=Thanatephorus cucumeris (strain AG1-IA) TaxID=983506 RepID=L8WGT8_THACA|nr:hypothetical protein AG1IA_10033 [Rhizoctonia solani AG-1 IA]
MVKIDVQDLLRLKAANARGLIRLPSPCIGSLVNEECVPPRLLLGTKSPIKYKCNRMHSRQDITQARTTDNISQIALWQSPIG